MEECLFCRIVKGEIPSEKIYEDEKVYAFSDVDPKAPVHVLIVPKEHMADVTDPRAVALVFRCAGNRKATWVRGKWFPLRYQYGYTGRADCGPSAYASVGRPRPRVAARLMVRNRPTAGREK